MRKFIGMNAQVVDAHEELRRFVGKYATQREAAEVIGISQPHLSDMVNGRREVTPKVLDHLGLRRAVVKAK